MSSKEKITQEVELTIWRLSKIYWSQAWRAVLMFIPFIFSIFLYGGFREDGIHQTQEIIDQFMNISLSLHYALWLIFLYFVGCFLFRLIIGKNYSDFTLTFVPKLTPKMPGYLTAIFWVSWAYFWRTFPVMVGFNLLASAFPILNDNLALSLLSLCIEVVFYILLLRLVLNKPYGNVRLSLVKREGDV